MCFPSDIRYYQIYITLKNINFNTIFLIKKSIEIHKYITNCDASIIIIFKFNTINGIVDKLNDSTTIALGI